MDAKKNFRRAIVVSTMTAPTTDAIAAKRMMEAHEKVYPRAVAKDRDLSGAKLSVEDKGAISYLVCETSTKRLKMVSENKTAEELLALCTEENSDAETILKDNAVVVGEEDLGEEPAKYTSGEKLKTILGPYTVVECDSENIVLLDANNETIEMSLSDFSELDPMKVGEEVKGTPVGQNEEATQTGDIATPMDPVGTYSVTFKKLAESGEEEEETRSADSKESFDAMVEAIRNDENFIEIVAVDTPEELENASESMLTPGHYRTDMGPVQIIRKNADGTLFCAIDGQKISIEVSDLELVHPKRECTNDVLLRSLYESTGISGRVSPDGRYIHLTGGRLRGPAVIESPHLSEYVEAAKRGSLSSTPTFRWRG